jgi:hypothetical protein
MAELTVAGSPRDTIPATEMGMGTEMGMATGTGTAEAETDQNTQRLTHNGPFLHVIRRPHRSDGYPCAAIPSSRGHSRQDPHA